MSFMGISFAVCIFILLFGLGLHRSKRLVARINRRQNGSRCEAMGFHRFVGQFNL
jgi:hypothetical protein